MYSAESFVGAQHANIRRAHSNWAKNDYGLKLACSPLKISVPKSAQAFMFSGSPVPIVGLEQAYT